MSKRAGEFTKILATKIYAVEMQPANRKRIANLIECAKEACQRLDRMEIAKIDAVAARVQAENDMCVMRGELNKLKRGKDAKKEES